MQHVKHSDDSVWGGKRFFGMIKSSTEWSALNTRVCQVFIYQRLTIEGYFLPQPNKGLVESSTPGELMRLV
ncbi:MAG: hypothetical protein KME31_27750 [Tolypothrix carrinoi HA7290-LM1]|nr:hypothetical protein [Tolypothrix carrinoi HA7290-LM1]